MKKYVFGMAMFLGVVSLPSVAHAQSDTVVHIALGAHMIAEFADMSTTEFNIGTGQFREANPLLRWAVDRGPVPAAVVKGSFAVGLNYLLIKEHRQHPKLTFWGAIGMTIVTSLTAVHNARISGSLIH